MAWIGSIIGFYFGQRPVREVLTRLQESEKEYIQKINIVERVIEKSHHIIDVSSKVAEEAEKEKIKGK